MDTRTYWDRLYASTPATDVSWYQSEPAVSLGLIRAVVREPSASIIDVGAGASTLIDRLLEAGYRALTVLDISGEGLAKARSRLGDRADLVAWVEADVLTHELPSLAYDFWHDRAVFHFLTDASERRRYVEQVRRSVRVGGHVAVATFATDGPTHCSGLEVVRYGPDDLHAEFGDDFHLVESDREEHVTPSGGVQPFTYCMCRLT